MINTVRVQLMGAKYFKGRVEGQDFDSCKLFVLLPVDDQSGNAVGFQTVALDFGKSDNFSKVRSLKFPAQVDLDQVQVSRGGGLRTVVSDVRQVKV